MIDIDNLVSKLKQKDVNAFEKLHEMYSKNICGAINVIVNDEAIAKELCQDVFLKVWEKSDMYDKSKGRFFTWLLNIARNKAIDYTRSKAYKIKKKNHSIDLFVSIGEKPTEIGKDPEEYKRLRFMLKTLKDKCIEIIKNLYFKGMTQADAAESLSIPLGTVKSRNRNCIKELRNKMSDG